MHTPTLPTVETLGLNYFARLTDKARKKAAGTLREDFCESVGGGLDGLCASFLGVDYDQIAAKAIEETSDEAVLKWCQEQGRLLSESEVLIWNLFSSKLGWKDDLSSLLASQKEKADLSERADIETFFQFMAVDEA